VLERKGLIAKQGDARHGKRIHLTLTAAGDALLQAGWAERLESALAATGADEAHLRQDLVTLVRALQQVNGNRAFGVCRHCEHFRTEGAAYRCGLTGDPLAEPQTIKICREWQSAKAA
jgi:MarR family transcriptional repressor of emrRAB